MSHPPLQQKEELRSQMRRKLNSLAPEQVDQWGDEIQKRILTSKIFREASSLALYYPYQNEVKTQDLFEMAKKGGKKVAFPRGGSEGQTLSFYWVDSVDQLKPTVWGPLGPDQNLNLKKASRSSIDLMVIPGLAFDLQGWRLGRGKGFYDRTLKGFSGRRLGVAYTFQVLDSIPHETGDEPIQWLATEKKMFAVMKS